MNLSFVKRDPDKGYIGRQLWLPKKHINTRSVKAGLEFPIMDATGVTYLQLWEDAQDHLIVPREFIPKKDYGQLKFEIVSTQMHDFRKVVYTSRIVLDKKKPENDRQKVAFNAMSAADSGILNLGCGVGKTVIALEHIAKSEVPALVVVNNTTLISQWKERIETFLDVGGGVGVVQGNPKTWDWQGRGIVLAMIHSLSLRYEELPVGFDRYFGGIYYDEVHHLSAPLFVKTAPMFYGKRYGLTATAEREDGLEGVYMYHVGGIFHRDLMPELKPRIYFQVHPLHVREHDPEVKREICDKTGQVNIPKYRGYLGRHVENNEFIAHKVSEPLKVGRKVLVLSHSKDQLKLLHQMFPESGLCTGDEEPDARMKVLREKRLTFGTLQLVKEALDEQTLDTLFFLTAFGSSSVEGGGKGTLQQGMGRILREMSGKKTPVVIILDYVNIPKFHKMCRRMKGLLHGWPVDQGGPYEYEIIKPYKQNGSMK